MNRIIFNCVFLIAFNHSLARENIFGNYRDFFGSELEIYSDSTFRYRQHFDLIQSWSIGRWKTINDTIYFRMIPVFDTIQYWDDKTNLRMDSLFLSIDEKSNRGFDSFFTYTDGKKEYYSGQNLHTQNIYEVPTKLYYRKNKLFAIDAGGKIVRKKMRGFWTSKKYPSWYITK
ncbi:MAG: hypothetical protein EHM20_10355 [Alphaproteobacteria bacterium]|nr:MAG: hypothetical protein EHM20_10355 [Alphaproteobacteria bacterium]